MGRGVGLRFELQFIVRSSREPFSSHGTLSTIQIQPNSRALHVLSLQIAVHSLKGTYIVTRQGAMLIVAIYHVKRQRSGYAESLIKYLSVQEGLT